MRSAMRVDVPVMSMKALVIEDDADAGILIEEMLKSIGFDVSRVEHPHDALFSLSSQMPDLLVLDLCLPGMNGPAFLDSVRSMRDEEGLPVVAVSAVYPRESPVAQAALDKGAAIFLGKPFTLDALRIAVRKALGGKMPGTAPGPAGAAAPDPGAGDDDSGPTTDDDSPVIEVLDDDFDDEVGDEAAAEDSVGFDQEFKIEEGDSSDQADAMFGTSTADPRPSANEATPAPTPPAPAPARAKQAAPDTSGSVLPPIQAFLPDSNVVLVAEECSETELRVRCAGAELEVGSSFRAEMSYKGAGRKRPIRFKMLLTVYSYQATQPVGRAHLHIDEIKPHERWKQLVSEVQGQH